GFGDDAAIVCGMARFHSEEVMLIATQKGRDMKQRVHRNFGTPHPEGYRKSIRIMQLAEKFRRPILTLIDTDGAYPGVHAEELGAHRDHEAAAALLDASLQKHLADLKKTPPVDLVVSRYNKFRNIAQFFNTEA